ncbi:hypothetical protein RZE82_07425 [Mollicutes bacterium LVI A0039]|nr:hypothetical protein RZE82_07425 [Mollicutes bacterium LVI A0039]
MNKLYTKSSSEAKLNEEDIKVFSRVCEKGINEFTQLNTEFTDNFTLTDDQQFQYGLKKLRVLKDLTPNQFCKVAISDKCVIDVEQVKNKIFFKCYQSQSLVLEIAMSVNQLEALEEKYNCDFVDSDGTIPTDKFQIFYAGTFMRKTADGPLSSKLTDLRLLKIAYSSVVNIKK